MIVQLDTLFEINQIIYHPRIRMQNSKHILDIECRKITEMHISISEDSIILKYCIDSIWYAEDALFKNIEDAKDYGLAQLVKIRITGKSGDEDEDDDEDDDEDEMQYSGSQKPPRKKLKKKHKF